MTANMQRLRGRNMLVLNWRDVGHPQAGGAEQYMHEIARRWVADGVKVTWLTARIPGTPRREVIDGVEVLRAGGPLMVYLRTAIRLLRSGRRFDAIVDCQNGIPFFAPIWTGWRAPVVQVIHHVHQDQFATRFSRPMAAVGRSLEGRGARRVYGRRAIAAVSASTRQELRCRLGLRGPAFVVPNGTVPVPEWTGPRDPDPTIAVVTRLVPHKQVDLLLHHLVAVAEQIPRLHVDIVGDGPMLASLRDLASGLGLSGIVTFHGRQPDRVRDDLLQRAWLTVSTSAGEGWGCSVIEAAAWGVPCLALDVPGIRDAVVHNETGWLIQRPEHYGSGLIHALTHLADDAAAEQIAERCQAWARCFSWDRSAELLAGVVAYQVGADQVRRSDRGQRRDARPDIATVVHCTGTVDEARLRATDQVHVTNERTNLLLGGCDEFDAVQVLHRVGLTAAEVHLADRYDLLAGPQGMPEVLATRLREPRTELA
jgi:glycosyltransferase involved in cell wall biosynthesis